MLASKVFANLIKNLAETYDYVFIDTPPVGLFTDASIVSTLCDGIFYVVKSSDTKKEEISQALENLKRVDANILGMVLTHAHLKKNKYGNYY